MEKVLECDLKFFSLSEILFFFEKFKKTGKIEITYKDKKGEIFLEEGKCVHSIFLNSEGIDALYEMAQLVEGKMEFFAGVLSEKRTIYASHAVIHEEIEKRSYEIRDLKSKLPSLDTVMKKTDTPPSPELTLRKTDWKLLTLIDGERPLRRVIEESGLGLLEAYKGLVFLKEKGLIIDAEESKKATEKILKYLNTWTNELGGDLEEERKKIAESIQEMVKNDINYPALSENLIFDAEFKFKSELNLSFKDVEDIMKKLDERLKQRLEETYGKILAKKKFETIKKKIEE